jgi:hypothetical protein
LRPTLKNLGRDACHAWFLIGIPILIVWSVNSRPVPIEAGAETRRQTWCPTPELRAMPIADPGPPEPELDTSDPLIPNRGADVTPIAGASGLSAAELARRVNRLILEVNPAVEVRSVSLSWPDGSGDAYLVVAWERSKAR